MPVTNETHHQTTIISLNEHWQLSSKALKLPISLDFPNDIHSVLLANQCISDPYFRDTETTLDWIHENDWSAVREFELPHTNGHWILRLEGVDTCVQVRVNDTVIAELANQFVRHDIPLRNLQSGRNRLEILFHSNSQRAVEKNKQAPFPIPYLAHNCRIPHINFLRKTQCHAGWDWNIALMPFGIYGNIALINSDIIHLNEVKVIQDHQEGKVRLTVFIYGTGYCTGTTQITARMNGETIQDTFSVLPQVNCFTLNMDIHQPRLWWPNGYGEAYLYPLEIEIAGQVYHYAIGLRTVTLITTPDSIGNRFAFAINGREIFMRGANWIPADALPARATPAVMRDLLQSACDVNMNMLRVWGGGQYETEVFYALCDAMGIMVWQDFMFACNIYPGYDSQWLKQVKQEAQQQARRLSQHASVILWCGDNELVGALNWFPETQQQRDRYIANYDRLNHTLEQVVAEEATQIPFWPSSPSVGRLHFGDGWHDDRSGDMHFWDVWHSAKDFEHYRTVRPRFCSEFGFQSFPSVRLIEQFTLPEDRNISSKIMEIHQRNAGGNSRIVETIARYFRFPDGFEQLVFYSQIAQALAMKTAIEFWRSHKPRCMGTLYWQLNDTWPVVSWASLEYGGAWKLVHYLARHYFAPVLVTAQPDETTDDIVLWAINDTPEPVTLQLYSEKVSLAGDMRPLAQQVVTIPTDKAISVARYPKALFSEQDFLAFHWHSEQGSYEGENTYFIQRYKYYDFHPAQLQKTTGTDQQGDFIMLQSDKPLLFVTLNLGEDTVFSDNGFILLPHRPKTIRVARSRNKHAPNLAAVQIHYVAATHYIKGQ